MASLSVRHITGSATTSLLLLTLLAWAAHWRLDAATAARAAAAAQLEYQHLVAGVRLPLASLTEEIDPRVLPNGRTVGHLVFVLSDTCRYAVEDLSYWRQLVDMTPPGVAVWIVTKQGEVLAGELTTRAARNRVAAKAVRPVDTWRFPVVTGLRGTPATALLDAQMCTRLVAWRMTPPTVAVFAAELNAMRLGNGTSVATER